MDLGKLGERFNPGGLAWSLNTTVMSINPNNSKKWTGWESVIILFHCRTRKLLVWFAVKSWVELNGCLDPKVFTKHMRWRTCGPGNMETELCAHPVGTSGYSSGDV